MKKLFLNKYAVESFDWIPKNIQNYLNKIDTITKNPDLTSFREPLTINEVININKSKVEEFKLVITYNLLDLGNVLFNAKKVLTSRSNLFEDQFYKTLNNKLIELANKAHNLADNCNFDVVNNNKITVDKNVFKLSKYYNNLFNQAVMLCNEYMPQIKEKSNALYEKFQIIMENIVLFDNIPGKVDWDHRGDIENLEVVFTTDYKDLLGMSSRSTWTSCQDLRPTKEKVFEETVNQILGSLIEKDVGMIYITNTKQYKEYGEQIIYRSIVWMIYNKNSGEKGLFIPTIYPNDSDYMKELFATKLENHLNIPIIERTDAIQDYMTKFTKEHPGPYSDIKLTNETDASEQAVERLGQNLDFAYRTENIDIRNNIGIYIEIMKQLKDPNTELGGYYKNIQTTIPIDKFYDMSFKTLIEEIINNTFIYIKTIIDEFKYEPFTNNFFNRIIREKLLIHVDSKDLLKRFVFIILYHILTADALFNDLFMRLLHKKPAWMSGNMFKSIVIICLEDIFWGNKKSIHGV